MSMTVNLPTDLLRTFAVIAEIKSFTKAAEILNRTQSAISMQMQRLEEILGRPLFIRGKKEVALSAAGEAFAAYAKRILQLNDEAISAFLQPEMVGLVRLGVPDDYAMLFLPPILSHFSHDFPLVQVEVCCEPSKNLFSLIDKKAIDLAIVICRPDVKKGETLFLDPTVWVTSEQHLVHEKAPLPLAVFPGDCFFKEWSCSALDSIGKKYRIAFSSPSIMGIQATVSAGLAVSVLGRSILPSGCRILGEDDGFPRLPPTRINLLRSSGMRAKAVDSLAEYINAFARGSVEGGRRRCCPSAGFRHETAFSDTNRTSREEQRSTKLMRFESLADFLDPDHAE